jgi:hypothetical protein
MLFNNAHYVFEAFNRAMAFFFRCLPNHRVLYTEFWDGFSLVVSITSWNVSYRQPVASLSVQGSWLGCYQGGCSSLWPLCSVYCSPCTQTVPYHWKDKWRGDCRSINTNRLWSPQLQNRTLSPLANKYYYFWQQQRYHLYTYFYLSLTVLHHKKQFMVIGQTARPQQAACKAHYALGAQMF